MTSYDDAVILLFLPVLLGSQIGKANLFTMVTEGQMYVLNVGDDVTLQCEFQMDHFNLFYNPVIWLKIQYHESTEMNIMGNMKEPFASTGKFRVYFKPTPPIYVMGLSIQDLTLQDSGNYTCEVRAPGSKLLGQVTHRIFIRAHVIDVAVYQDASVSRISTSHVTPPILSFVEDTPSSIKCIAEGGNPPPEVEMLLGHRDVTDQFHVQTYPTLSGEKGFRLMQTTTVIWSDYFRVSAEDDKKKLKCKVTIPGLGSQTAVAMLEVNYAPTIYCKPAEAHLGDKNVYLSCEVRARPGVTALYWELDANGTVVTEGIVVNEEYWVINMDQGDNMIQTQLYMREVKQESFRTYTLVAENNVAVTSRNVELKRLHYDMSLKPQLASGHELKSHYVSGARKRPNPKYVFIQGSSGCRHHGSSVLFVCISVWILSAL